MVGVRQVDDHMWLVSFMHDGLGYFDDETCRLENSFRGRVLAMSRE
jgi:putative transposase